jgi:uncharacterized membrane protein
MVETLLLAGALEGALIGAAIGALVGLIAGVVKMIRERSGGAKTQPRKRKRRRSPDEAEEPGVTRKPSRRPSGGKPSRHQ